MRAQAVSAAAFAPFGTLVQPGLDGAGFGPQDAQLELSQGCVLRALAQGRRVSITTK